MKEHEEIIKTESVEFPIFFRAKTSKKKIVTIVEPIDIYSFENKLNKIIESSIFKASKKFVFNQPKQEVPKIQKTENQEEIEQSKTNQK